MIDPKEVLRVCNKATPGPWEYGKHHKGSFPAHYAISQSGEMYDHAYVFSAEDGGEGKANAQFIALARTALPKLAQRVIELEADNAKLREAANDIYPMVAGRVIQLQMAGEEKAAAEWNAVAKKLYHFGLKEA